MMCFSERFRGAVFAVMLIIACSAQKGEACSTFCLDNAGQPVFGRNLDWHVEDALIIVNKRNMAKTASVQESPATWVSQYGSVTFNQYGREFPHGGINEAGLVVEQMWLTETEYAAPDVRAGVDALQWIQYQLDTARSIADVLASDAHVRIVPNGAELHYLVCDRTGECATVEILYGRMVTHTAETLPVKALTNGIYTSSVEELQHYEGFGGTTPIPTPDSSGDTRFIRVADRVRRYDPATSGSAIDYAFDTLTNVSQGEYTKWSIVYDIAAARVYFRTLTRPQIRSFDLSAFDFSCNTPVKILDINLKGAGDVTDQFVDYTLSQNQTMIEASFKKTEFLANTPTEELAARAEYPDQFLCQE